MVTTTITAICNCTFSVATNRYVFGCGLPTSMRVRGASRKCNGSSPNIFVSAGQRCFAEKNRQIKTLSRTPTDR
jgi:hypothetical protein